MKVDKITVKTERTDVIVTLTLDEASLLASLLGHHVVLEQYNEPPAQFVNGLYRALSSHIDESRIHQFSFRGIVRA